MCQPPVMLFVENVVGFEVCIILLFSLLVWKYIFHVQFSLPAAQETLI